MVANFGLRVLLLRTVVKPRPAGFAYYSHQTSTQGAPLCVSNRNYSTSNSMSGDLVLVSGASGYLGSWICKKLQEQGFRVRGTVRSLKNASKVEYLRNLTPNPQYPIELVEADLVKADGWPEAVKGCKYVLHTASPFFMAKPSNPDELIKPAVEGTLTVLRAAAEAGTVQRIVVTSSYAACVESGRKEGAYTGEDWSIADKQNNIYMRSKTLAEKAAWDFVKELPHGKKFELCTILPVAIMGPPLSSNSSESIDTIVQIMTGKVAMVPKITANLVDIRDVAQAHVNCLTVPDAVGKRFILDCEGVYYPDLVEHIAAEFNPQGYKIPTRQMPNPLFKLASCFSEQVKDLRTLGEKPKEMDISPLKNILGITPIPIKKTVIEMAYALVENGKVPKTDKYKGPPAASQ